MHSSFIPTLLLALTVGCLGSSCVYDWSLSKGKTDAHSDASVPLDGEIIAAADDADTPAMLDGDDVDPSSPDAGDTVEVDADSVEPLLPMLSDLSSSAGALGPAFDAAVTRYTLAVDITVQTVTLTPTIPDGVVVAVAGKPVESGVGWTSDVLNLGDNKVSLVVSQDGYPSNTYEIIVTRGFQEAYVKASNTGPSDAFGTSVAIDGDTLVVGAPYEDSSGLGENGNQEDDPPAKDSGAAYVFKRSEGVWRQSRYLKATNTEAGDHFGASVAFRRAGGRDAPSILVVGAPGEDGGSAGFDGDQFSNSAPDSGAAYVFDLDPTGGIIYLKCGTKVAHSGDACGSSIATWDRWVALGAPGEDSASEGSIAAGGDRTATDSGAVFLFSCGRGDCDALQRVKASNAGSGDSFGQSVALSGVLPADGTAPRRATLVVGAPGEDGPATGVGGDGSHDVLLESGAAYVFGLLLDAVGQLAYVKASNTGAGDAFGSAVSASENLIVVGAPRESSSARGVNGRIGSTLPRSGAAYLYLNNAEMISFSAHLKATNPGPEDLFGTSVSVSKSLILVGAPGEDSKASGVGGDQQDNSSSNAGAAYSYAMAGNAWVPDAYFKPNRPGVQDGFGQNVATSEGTVVVAAPGEDSTAMGINSSDSPNSADASGAVYIFR